MKIFVAFLAVLAVSTYAAAAVVPMSDDLHIEQNHRTGLEDVDANGGVAGDSGALIIRERRLTCDFFSFESKVATPNHAACAAKCMGKGKKGGSCHGANCVCRKDKWIG